MSSMQAPEYHFRDDANDLTRCKWCNTLPDYKDIMCANERAAATCVWANDKERQRAASMAHEVEHIVHLRKAITVMRNRDRSQFQQRMYDALRNVQDMLEADLAQRGIDLEAALAAADR